MHISNWISCMKAKVFTTEFGHSPSNNPSLRPSGTCSHSCHILCDNNAFHCQRTATFWRNILLSNKVLNKREMFLSNKCTALNRGKVYYKLSVARISNISDTKKNWYCYFWLGIGHRNTEKCDKAIDTITKHLSR